MWSRRTFLQHASIAVASIGAFDSYGATAKTGPLGRPIGLQLFTLAAAAAKDFEGTLKAIAEMGYREVELPGPVPRKPAELRKLFADLGLTCPSIHAAMMELVAGADQKIELAGELGAEYLVCSFPWTSDARFRKGFRDLPAQITLDDWKWNADQLNRVGELARKAGIRVGYHNHNMEFRSYDGVIAFDELLRLTDPVLVAMELDIAWVVTAGADPIHYLREHATRVELLHLKEVRKDLKVTADQLLAQTTELGNGQIDWTQVFAAMNPKHVRHYFVEQENFERSPLESVRIDFDYLQRLGATAKL